jgi:hypothetical protein
VTSTATAATISSTATATAIAAAALQSVPEDEAWVAVNIDMRFAGYRLQGRQPAFWDSRV